MIGATLPQYAAWLGATVIGVFGESLIADPAKLGLNAFFLILLKHELRDARAVAVAGLALVLRVPMLLAVALAVAAMALVRAVG